MRRCVSVLTAFVTALLPLTGQVRDSSAFHWTQLIAPTVLMGSGLAVHYAAHDTWDVRIHDRLGDPDAKRFDFDDVAQYVPVTMAVGLKACGVPSRHHLVDIMIETSISYLTLLAMSCAAKPAFHTLRPNGSNYRSFPSGHTMVSFTGAELTRIEYGWGWGAGAYAVAGGVGFMRIRRNYHWFSDVLMGAGVGILCANVGRWLLPPVHRWLRVDSWNKDTMKPGWRRFLFDEKGAGVALVPVCDPFTGYYGASFAIRF